MQRDGGGGRVQFSPQEKRKAEKGRFLVAGTVAEKEKKYYPVSIFVTGTLTDLRWGSTLGYPPLPPP